MVKAYQANVLQYTASKNEYCLKRNKIFTQKESTITNDALHLREIILT